MIGVVGAGAVGLYVGGALASAQPVVIVGRQRQRAALEEHGITAIALAGQRRVAAPVALRFATDLAALAPCKTILVAVKSAQTAELGEALAVVVARDALVVSLQNGVRNAESLRAAIASEVAAGIVTFNVVSGERGVVRQTTSGPLVIEDKPGAADLLAALSAVGLEAEVHADIAARQWAKLVINLSNAISALSGAPTRELISEPGYRRVISAVMNEALDVLAAAKIKPATMRGLPLRLLAAALKLPTPVVRVVARAQMKVDPRARSSMWQDLELRRPTEVDYLNGEIVRLAAENGARAPLNARLGELIKAAEAAQEGSPNLAADALASALELA